MTLVVDLSEMAEVLDESSWEWLEETSPRLAGVVRKLVERGVTPDELRQFVKQYARQPDLAQMVMLAAKYLTAQREINAN